MSKLKQPNSKQIRDHYQAQGYEVRVSKDGHISFRLPFQDAIWKDGRYISEYRIDERGSVQLI